jgi:hypothetical protein
MKNLDVTPLSLSQLLKEKNVRQESMFYWADHEDGHWVLVFDFDPNGDKDPIVGYGDDLKEDEDGGYYSAFTLSELPDVFRQVFKEEYFEREHQWAMFCAEYFRAPAEAWEALEQGIRKNLYKS